MQHAPLADQSFAKHSSRTLRPEVSFYLCGYRDKCTTEELAASLGRKCESLEQEVEKSTAAVQEMQRKTKVRSPIHRLNETMDILHL